MLAEAFLGLSIGQMAIWLVVVFAILAILWVAMNQFGFPRPSWVVNIIWILLVAVVCILAIRFLMSL